MGLFSQRPEEPTEWAGLPSEPTRPETTAERLPDASAIDVGTLGLPALGLGGPGDPGTSVASIVIPVTPLSEMPGALESGDVE